MTKMNFPKVVPLKGRVRVCLELLKRQELKNKIIVDIGCSFGWLEKEIEKEPVKEIIGIDIAKEAINFAKSNTKRAKFFRADCLALPLPDQYADIVIVYDVIEHLPKDKERLGLQEVRRVLKNNGILLLSTPFSHPLSTLLDIAWYFGHRHYSQKMIIDLLDEIGFEIDYLTIRGSPISCLYLSINIYGNF